MIAPPINPKVEGLSLINRNAQIGPRTDSDNIITPTIADGSATCSNCYKYKSQIQLGKNQLKNLKKYHVMKS